MSAKIYNVHTGRPSWHQKRAGHPSSGIMVFHTREEAERYVERCKELRPDEPAWIEETDQATKFARRYGLTMTAKQIDARPGGAPMLSDWPAGSTHWRIRLSVPGTRRSKTLLGRGDTERVSMVIYYTMGPAHKETPNLATVLECLAGDASSADQDFETWCGGFGYDTDSRRALKVWAACVNVRKRLIELLGTRGLDDLLSVEW